MEDSIKKKLRAQKYYNKEKNLKNPIFLSRFAQLNFEGLVILDLGCGHGALSIDLADKGAKEIVGADINCELIEFANENLKNNFPHYLNKITFVSEDFRNLENYYFDLIISKASFEHFIELETQISEMKNKLKIGGKIAAGFGPLYNSPFGDHGWLGYKYMPWMHIIMPEKYSIKRINKQRTPKINGIEDFPLNGYSLKKYKKIFTEVNGLSLIYFKTNVSKKLMMKIFNIFSYIPILKEYFTYNVYCILKRDN